MSERRLKRQLSLWEVLMLGTAGTIAAEMFVLTGHVAGMSGPAGILALFLVGLLSYGVALNYCELATAFPVTGGALTYVREAWGTGLLSFLVGSLDCLSSTFYAALSAVGFAYSLHIFFPFLPIVPVALVTAALFTLLHILGVSNVGRLQIVLGGVLLLLLGSYIVLGLSRPLGFSWEVLAPNGRIFVQGTTGANVARLFATMALIFNAYVGFEIIADDAEEIKAPHRNIPLGILVSLTIITILYTLSSLVTMGTIPWSELAGSEAALAEAAARFLPRLGAPLIGLAGIIATLTSVNTAMLSATREALTMSRDGMWPRFMSRLGRLRTPYAASLVIGGTVALVALIGLVDFLSYISSSGYLFVVFWASLAMIRLRRLRPELPRPFRVPLYPITPYLAAGTCILVIAFTAWRPLAFGLALIVALISLYYVRRPLAAIIARHAKANGPVGDRILVPVANPHTAEGLMHLATILAQRTADTSVGLLGVVPIRRRVLPAAAHEFVDRLARQQRALLGKVTQDAHSHNIPVYTKLRAAPSIAEGILQEIHEHGNDKLILMGWPGPPDARRFASSPVGRVLQEAHTNVAVFLNRGGSSLREILVPVGGNPHSRLALRLAAELGEQANARVTAMRCFCSEGVEEMHDDLMFLREMIAEEFGEVPPHMATKVVAAPSLPDGISQELREQHYDLVVMGAAMARSLQRDLFGSLTDQIAAQISCSILLIHRYEPSAITWVRQRLKQIAKE